MTAETAESPGALGRVDLFAPADWLDFVEDDRDVEAARQRFGTFLADAYAVCAPSVRSAALEAMLGWRDRLLAQGCLMHGVIAHNGDHDRPTPVFWQIMAGVVDLPPAPSDLDVAAVLERALATGSTDPGYTETFETDMGAGVGLITQSEVRAEDAPIVPGFPAPDPKASVVIGLAAALAFPRSGGHGLLVVGVSLDEQQVLEVAGLVAAVAGRSVVHPARS